MKQLTAALTFVLISASANALTISYSDFSDLSDFQLNGSAATITNPAAPGNALRLTNSFSQKGSAFFTDSFALTSDTSFSTRFDFRISAPMGSADLDGRGADGLMFVINTLPNTLGGAGGNLGYKGLTDSLGVEFDTWNNGAWDDFNGNHAGINLAGNMDSVVQAPVATRMNNGAVWTAWIDYDGASNLLEVRLSDSGLRSALALLSLNVDLGSVLGAPNAFVGFSSGTGDATGYHDILNFEFRDFVAVGEPGSLALLMLGLFGLTSIRFRKT